MNQSKEEWFMLSFDRLSGIAVVSSKIFWSKRAPGSAMKLDIRLHLAGKTLLDTVSTLENLGVDRH